MLRWRLSRLGLEIIVVFASTENEIENALTAAVEQRAAAIVVASDVFFSSRREYIALLALRHALPTISDDRIAVVAVGRAIDELCPQFG